MAWQEESDKGGGRQDRMTRAGLSKEVTIKQKTEEQNVGLMLSKIKGHPAQRSRAEGRQERRESTCSRAASVPAACLSREEA